MPITKPKDAEQHRIDSLDAWKTLAGPRSEDQWQDDRSAKEVARAWLEGGGTDLPPEVHAALAAHPHFGPVTAWEAEPEARLRFDDSGREPRNCDLAVLAQDEFGPYLLAVEAKADETYGRTVGQALRKALERRIAKPKSKALARIESLAVALLLPFEEGLSEAGDLRYQLLTACAGAVAEAERRGTTRAVMLVHEFVTARTSDKGHARNAADLASFVGRVSGRACQALADGVLLGPFEQRLAPGVQLYVGKVTRQLRPEGVATDAPRVRIHEAGTGGSAQVPPSP